MEYTAPQSFLMFYSAQANTQSIKNVYKGITDTIFKSLCSLIFQAWHVKPANRKGSRFNAHQGKSLKRTIRYLLHECFGKGPRYISLYLTHKDVTQQQRIVFKLSKGRLEEVAVSDKTAYCNTLIKTCAVWFKMYTIKYILLYKTIS